MGKTIVSIISEQPTPNYLLIREIFEPGDELMFITSTRMEHNINHIVDTLNWNPVSTIRVCLKEGVEERWGEMCETIESVLAPDKQYAVNLTGGTKYMALAVQRVFEKYDSRFFYIPYPRNVMLVDNKAIPIATRINVKEYLSIHGRKIRTGSPIRSSEDAKSIFNSFCNESWNKLNDKDYKIIDALRCYRKNNIASIGDVEQKVSDNEKKPQIPGLSNFLDKIHFVPRDSNSLSKYENQYLTGGWFEEYVYYLVKEGINPTDIELGVKLTPTNNDLDVVFTKGNKLFVIECKTGIDREKMLTDIAYKSTAIKDYLRGISAYSYIFALAKDADNWTKISSNMGIGYYGRDYFVDSQKFETLKMQLISKSCD